MAAGGPATLMPSEPCGGKKDVFVGTFSWK